MKYGQGEETDLPWGQATIKIRFMGVRDIQSSSKEGMDVWYKFDEKIMPFERRKEWIPSKDKLFDAGHFYDTRRKMNRSPGMKERKKSDRSYVEL